MIRRILFVLLALTALAAPARAKDELVIGMTQSPGTWNPLISSMLAKSLISNMTARPLTAWNADWKLVCLACTEVPTIENGKARVIDLPDGKKSMEVDLELRDLKWGDGMPVTAKDVAFTLEVGQPSAVGRGLVGSLPAHHQVRRQGRPSLHHDDRPRHLRLQPHGPEPSAGAHREADLRGQPRRVPQQDGVRHQHDQPRPVLRSRTASSRSCPATASCWSRTRPGRARSPTSSASSSRSSRTPRRSRPTCCRATSTTCWASSACRSTRCWPSRSATRTSTTSSTSRR